MTLQALTYTPVSSYWKLVAMNWNLYVYINTSNKYFAFQVSTGQWFEVIGKLPKFKSAWEN